MLASLRIENFAIVKELELDFKQGMTAFTGETGAGKSIMIDALMLALGNRADTSVIRSGEEKCDISALFHIDGNSDPSKWLSANEIDCGDGELLLRRVLTAEGRSKLYINGQLFPAQKVKELSEMLVHIHGQHQHQTLMQPTTHRQQLDHFAGHDALLNQVQSFYSRHQKIKQEMTELMRQNEHQDKLNLLQFQIEELTALEIQNDEARLLNEEHQLLHHANDFLLHAEQINFLLNADDEKNLCQTINKVLYLLNQLPSEQACVKNALELMNSALIQCEETITEMQTLSENIQLDPARLIEVENRLTLLHQMARKYHVDIHYLSEHLTELQHEFSRLNIATERISLLEKELVTISQEYEKAAAALRQSRQHYAQKLSQEITAIIKQLGMPKGQITIDISPLEKMQPFGMDKIEYKVCTNPGMPPDALTKIASGGELSRISLAIQMITAQRGSTPTLFFDEVDVGIGGATAALVGQLLRKLGERLQVFCVTHQPQVAASAHNHFVVEKNSVGEKTFSTIITLNEIEKINEIARMLGGLTVTEQSRSHAKELLLQSH